MGNEFFQTSKILACYSMVTVEEMAVHVFIFAAITL